MIETMATNSKMEHYDANWLKIRNLIWEYFPNTSVYIPPSDMNLEDYRLELEDIFKHPSEPEKLRRLSDNPELQAQITAIAYYSGYITQEQAEENVGGNVLARAWGYTNVFDYRRKAKEGLLDRDEEKNNEDTSTPKRKALREWGADRKQKAGEFVKDKAIPAVQQTWDTTKKRSAQAKNWTKDTVVKTRVATKDRAKQMSASATAGIKSIPQGLRDISAASKLVREREQATATEHSDAKTDTRDLDTTPFTNDVIGGDMEQRLKDFVLDRYEGMQTPEKLNLRNALRNFMIEAKTILETPNLSREQRHDIIRSRRDELIPLIQGAGFEKNIAQDMAQDARLAAHRHYGWIKGGGPKLSHAKYEANAYRAPYKSVLVGIKEMKEATLEDYYKNNPNAKRQSFEQLTKKWGDWQRAWLYSILTALPVAGALGGAALATGGVSLWIHAFAGISGLVGGKLLSNMYDSIGSISGSKLRDIEELGGIRALEKGIVYDKDVWWLPSPKYTKYNRAETGIFIPPSGSGIIKKTLSLCYKTPNKQINYRNIAAGDLAYIIERGKQNEKTAHKIVCLVGALLPVIATGYLHKDTIAGVFSNLWQHFATAPPVEPATHVAEAVTGWQWPSSEEFWSRINSHSAASSAIYNPGELCDPVVTDFGTKSGKLYMPSFNISAVIDHISGK